MSVPASRSLPIVLRAQLRHGPGAELVVATVTAIPDADHVTVNRGGVVVTIPRLSSYTPTVGEPASCLASGSNMVALGAVGGV